ncbi:60S ribosomal protein L12 [Phlyctochytrium planicorne]|nr:60S ribosomal protein L12 [Phlyctochytrium planicorne]
MPPKFVFNANQLHVLIPILPSAITSPNEVKIVMLRTTGGEVAGGSALAPKIGPLGLSPKKIGEDIAKATQDWKGLRITVKLIVQNRQAAIEVVSSASSLVIKALKEPPRDKKKEKNIKHSGNISFADVLAIARTMRPKSMAKELRGTVREILGTAFSVGCTVDGQSPQDVSEKVASGEIEVPEAAMQQIDIVKALTFEKAADIPRCLERAKKIKDPLADTDGGGVSKDLESSYLKFSTAVLIRLLSDKDFSDGLKPAVQKPILLLLECMLSFLKKTEPLKTQLFACACIVIIYNAGSDRMQDSFPQNVGRVIHCLLSIVGSNDSAIRTSEEFKNAHSLIDSVLKMGNLGQILHVLLSLFVYETDPHRLGLYGTLLTRVVMQDGGILAFLDCIAALEGDADKLDSAHRLSVVLIFTAIPSNSTSKDYYNILFKQLEPILCQESVDSSDAFSLRKVLASSLVVKAVESRPFLGKKCLLEMLIEPMTRTKAETCVLVFAIDWSKSILIFDFRNDTDLNGHPILSNDSEVSKCISIISVIMAFGDPSEAFMSNLLFVLRPIFLLWELEKERLDRTVSPVFDILRSILILNKAQSSAVSLLKLVTGKKSKLGCVRSSSGGLCIVQVKPKFIGLDSLFLLLELLESPPLIREIFLIALEEYSENSSNARFLLFIETMLVRFGVSLCDDPIDGFRIAKTILLSCQRDENMATLALSILSLLLGDESLSKKISKEELEEVLIVAQTFRSSSYPELQNLAAKISERSKNLSGLPSERKPGSGSYRFEEALQELQDEIVPVRAHGIRIIQNMILDKDEFVFNNVDMILELLLEMMTDSESFIYLNGVKALSAALVTMPDEAIPILLSYYCNASKMLDARLRVGEAFMQAIQRLGEAFSKYAKDICNKLLQLMEKDKDILPSCFALLAFVTDVAPVALVEELVWISKYIEDMLVFEKSVPPRRAAVNFLCSLADTINQVRTVLPPGFTRSLIRILKRVYDTDSDPGCKHYAEGGLQRLRMNFRN